MATSIETLKRLETKVDQLWQIASHSACGRNVHAVLQINYDIQKLFSELRAQIERENHASSK